MSSTGRKLYVGNLSFELTEPELAELFSEAGTCESVAIITDRATGRSRGFAFVEMQTAEEASRAIELFHGREVKGRPLSVSVAREQSHGRPGGGGRRPPRGGPRRS